MIRIVTDSSADIPKEWIEEFEISVLPINLIIGGKSYRQGIDINHADFYRLVNEQHTIPQTSLPSPEQVMEFYEEISNPGDTILSIHLGSKLSGTFSTVQMAAYRLLEEYNVIPFDSNSGSAALAFMCREARMMASTGSKIQEIIKRLEYIRRKITIVFTIDNLEFALMSGRVNSLQAMLSSVLQIKPIVVLRDGLLNIGEKVRTRGKSLDRIVNLVHNRVGDAEINLAVVHANDPTTGKTLLDHAQSLLNCKNVFLADLSISVAAHLGPKAVGIVAYPVEEG
jgi:DegV family protein with EDD domain